MACALWAEHVTKGIDERPALPCTRLASKDLFSTPPRHLKGHDCDGSTRPRSPGATLMVTSPCAGDIGGIDNNLGVTLPSVPPFPATDLSDSGTSAAGYTIADNNDPSVPPGLPANAPPSVLPQETCSSPPDWPALVSEPSEVWRGQRRLPE